MSDDNGPASNVLRFRRRRPSWREEVEAARSRLAAQGLDLPRDEPPPEPDTSMLDPYLKIQIENNARREALGYPVHPIVHPDKEHT